MLNKVLEYMASMFDNHSKGASMRKFLAFALGACTIWCHAIWAKWAYYHNDFSLFPILLGADFAFIAGLLSLTTYQAVQNQKAQNKVTQTGADSKADVATINAVNKTSEELSNDINI